MRDGHGRVHLGQSKTVKRMFARSGAGVERYAKSKWPLVLVNECKVHVNSFNETRQSKQLRPKTTPREHVHVST